MRMTKTIETWVVYGMPIRGKAEGMRPFVHRTSGRTCNDASPVFIRSSWLASPTRARRNGWRGARRGTVSCAVPHSGGRPDICGQ